MKPRLLDAFCCSGGSTRGYQEAGYLVTGIDLIAWPDYCGDAFVQGDAVEYIREHGHKYDAIHASPPCQDHSALTKGNRRRGWSDSHTDLIPATREALLSTGRPFVIENVQGAPIRRDLTLCGLMFGLRVFRHRYFEVHGFTAVSPPHPTHRGHRVSGWRHGVRHEGDMVAVYGLGGGKGSVADWQQAMGLFHTADRRALAEALPPSFTRYIGSLMINQADSESAR